MQKHQRMLQSRLCLGNSRAGGSFSYMGIVPEIQHWGLWKGYCLKGTNQCWHKGISQIPTNPESPQPMQKSSIKSKTILNSFSVRAITRSDSHFPWKRTRGIYIYPSTASVEIMKNHQNETQESILIFVALQLGIS